MAFDPVDARVGQKFYDENRLTEGSQPNGTIIRVTKWEKEVVVQFGDGGIDSYDFNQLENHWTDKFGGMWRLYKPAYQGKDNVEHR